MSGIQEFKVVLYPRRGWYLNPRFWGYAFISITSFIFFGIISDYISPIRIARFAIGSYISFALFILVVVFLVFLWRHYRQVIRVTTIRDKQIQYFISANKLYETEKIEQKEYVKNHAVFGYHEDEKQLIVRAYKRADRFSEKMDSFDSMLSALFKLELFNRDDTITHTDYYFHKQEDKRIILSNNSHDGNGTSIYCNCNKKWFEKQKFDEIRESEKNKKSSYVTPCL